MDGWQDLAFRRIDVWRIPGEIARSNPIARTPLIDGVRKLASDRTLSWERPTRRVGRFKNGAAFLRRDVGMFGQTDRHRSVRRPVQLPKFPQR